MLDIQKLIWAPKIVVSEVDESTSTFQIHHLPRGFGHTLGNALRRIILGYNLGAAITGMNIKGVPHEYHIIDGVKESVIDMMLNFKKLRFIVDESVDNIQWVSQKWKGVGVYDATSLKLPAGITLLDNAQHLFEITDPSTEVIAEVRIEKGYGYYSIDFLRSRDQKEEGSSNANTLLIDNDFNVVEYVKYDVEEVIEDFAGTTKDTLIVEIQTSFPQVSPKQIIMFAGEVLASYAKLFIFDDIYVDKSVFVEYGDIRTENDRLPEESNVKTMPIDALPLSERTRNALIKNDILYVEDLEKKKKGELLLMKWVGRKAIEEINSSLSSINKSLLG